MRKSVARRPIDLDGLRNSVSVAFGCGVPAGVVDADYAAVAGGVLTGLVQVPTADYGAGSSELVNKAWVDRAIDSMPIAPEISPTFTGLVLGVTPASLQSGDTAATKGYVDGFLSQWSGGVPVISPDFQGDVSVEYGPGVVPSGGIVATMGAAYKAIKAVGGIPVVDGTLGASVVIPVVEDIYSCPGEVIIPKKQVEDFLSPDSFAPVASPVLSGAVSVASSDMSLSGDEIVSSWWVTQTAQSDQSGSAVTDCFGAIPWVDLSLTSPRITTSPITLENGSSLILCDFRGQMIFDASLGTSFYSEISPGQSARVTTIAGKAFYGTVNLFVVQDPGEVGPVLDQQTANVQLVFACSDATIVDYLNSSTLFSLSVSTAATRSSKAIHVKTVGQNYLAWAPECDIAEVGDASTKVATVGFVDRAMRDLGVLSSYISGFSLYTTGMEDGLYVGPGSVSLGITATSVFHLETALYKTPKPFSHGPGGGLIVASFLQMDASNGHWQPNDVLVPGWYNIYLLYDLATGTFDVCAVLSEYMTDPTFLFKETMAGALAEKMAARFIGLAYLHPSDHLGNAMHFARFVQQDGVLSFTPPDDARRESQYPTIKISGIEITPQSHRSRLNNLIYEKTVGLHKELKKDEWTAAYKNLNPDDDWLSWLGYYAGKVVNTVEGLGYSVAENAMNAMTSWEYDYNKKDFRADPVTIFTSGFLPSMAVGTGIIEGDFTVSIPATRLNQRRDRFVPPSVQITPFNGYMHDYTWDDSDRVKVKAKPGVSPGFDVDSSSVSFSNRYYMASTDTQALTLYMDDLPFSILFDPNEPPPDLVGSTIAGSDYYDFSCSAVLLMDIKRVRIDLSQFGPMVTASLRTVANNNEFALFDNNTPVVSLDGAASTSSLEASR